MPTRLEYLTRTNWRFRRFVTRARDHGFSIVDTQTQDCWVVDTVGDGEHHIREHLVLYPGRNHALSVTAAGEHRWDEVTIRDAYGWMLENRPLR